METCYADKQTYVGCTLAGSGLPVGTAAGQVDVTTAGTTNSYTVTAVSASGCSFIIGKTSTGTSRTASGTGCGTSW
jgi:tartrate dehydratase beta subunit/fumarate hydratase class I family protein